MITTEKRLQKLESLFLEGQTFLDTHYPKFKERSENKGHFNLAAQAGLLKHDVLYEAWYKKVLACLKRDIKNDLFTARFSRARYTKDYTLLAPDGYFLGLRELEKIIDEARSVFYAERQLKLSSQQEVIVVYKYKAPSLYLSIQEEDYLIHIFRRGKPKDLIEFALKRPSLTAYQTDFRTGGTAGVIIKEPFDTVLHQLKDNEKYKLAKLDHFIVELTSSKLKLNLTPFPIKSSEVRKIHDEFKKSE